MDSTVGTIILLIEDNSADVVLFEEALREHGIVCELVIKTDGGDALRYIKEIDQDPLAVAPELVILDLHLPKHDGEEIIESLRASARFASSAVIVTSSSDSSRDRQKAKSHRAFYFQKPATLDAYMEIGNLARKALSGKYDHQIGP